MAGRPEAKWLYRPSDLVPRADTIMVAKVIELLGEGPTPPKPAAPGRGREGAGDLGCQTATQWVRLAVVRVLKGDAPKDFSVTRPQALSWLEVGNRRPFFLAGDIIIGRYGPRHAFRAGHRRLPRAHPKVPLAHKGAGPLDRAYRQGRGPEGRTGKPAFW